MAYEVSLWLVLRRVLFGHQVHVVYEACGFGFGLYRRLIAAGAHRSEERRVEKGRRGHGAPAAFDENKKLPQLRHLNLSDKRIGPEGLSHPARAEATTPRGRTPAEAPARGRSRWGRRAVRGLRPARALRPGPVSVPAGDGIRGVSVAGVETCALRPSGPRRL